MSIDVNELPEEAQEALSTFTEFQISGFNDTGANGFVMLGRHKVLKKEVAIKIYYHDENEIDQEPAIIASLNHENILKVYDARKVSENCSYYVMQAANDGDLFNFLDRYHLSLSLAHRLLCQLLSGLSALHCPENFLVHRDLKPENLLVHDDTIVIADFGSVRKADTDTGQAPASKHSILYRPPEAFGDDAHFAFTSDVYQAGMIGFLLFGGNLSNDLLLQLTATELKKLERVRNKGDECDVSLFIDSCIEKRIKSGKVLDWSTLPPFVPNSIKRILKKAVSKYDTRYKNVSEFLADLSRVRANLPEWIRREEGCYLENWKGTDYLIAEGKYTFNVKKRRHGNKKFISDTALTGQTFEESFELLKGHVGLP